MQGSEVYGYGAIIIALIGLLTKIWMDSSRNTDRMTEAIKENAIALTELRDAVRNNTTATDKSTDHITKLILKVIKTK